MVKDLLDAELEVNPRSEWSYIVKIPKSETNSMTIQRTIKTDIREEGKYSAVPQLKTISSYCSLILTL
jgi:hypothetical protein